MKLLFISHNASRTGAPLLLLRLMAELAKDKGLELGVLVGDQGPLVEDFKKIAAVYVWKPAPTGPGTRLWELVIQKTGLSRLRSVDRHRKSINRSCRGYDVIVANTTWSISMLRQLDLAGKKVIAYVHELQVMTGLRASPADMQWLADTAFRTLAPCNFVKEFLVDHYRFDAGRIGILRYIIPPASPDCRKPVSLSPGVLLMGACGTLDWRKGYDIFLQIAVRLVHTMGIKDIRFQWVGADLDSVEYQILMNDIKKCELEEVVTVHGPTTHISDHFSQWDLFLLTSREDPYPLVVQEAAGFGVPAICFKEAGGIMEFLQEDAGIAVDYLNIDQYCDAIAGLRNDRGRLRIMADAARRRSRECNDAGEIARAFLEFID